MTKCHSARRNLDLRVEDGKQSWSTRKDKSLIKETKDLGGYSKEDPPLTIPNREVKLLSADGTTKVGE